MYTDGEINQRLFDDASEVLLELMGNAKNGRLAEVYDLALKAVDYYREYLEENQPFNHTTCNYSSRLTRKSSWLPYVKDSIVIPKNAVTSWEVMDCNGITHSKVEFLDHLAQYGGDIL